MTLSVWPGPGSGYAGRAVTVSGVSGAAAGPPGRQRPTAVTVPLGKVSHESRDGRVMVAESPSPSPSPSRTSLSGKRLTDRLGRWLALVAAAP